mgnify:CR=1 FL=1
MAKRTGNVKSTEDIGELSKTITVGRLAELMNQDRLRHGKSWKAYGAMLGIPQATLYKIYQGNRAKPHQTTVFAILTAIEANK